MIKTKKYKNHEIDAIYYSFLMIIYEWATDVMVYSNVSKCWDGSRATKMALNDSINSMGLVIKRFKVFQDSIDEKHS